MSLEEAGRLLGGLHPNTVRARAAKGKIRYEKDNSGKWFVFIDPDKAAGDGAKRRKLEPPARSLEVPIEPPNVRPFSGLEATIQVLNEELKAVRVERDELKVKLIERTEAAAQLEISMATLSAKSEAATEEAERLRLQLEQETDKNRKMLAEVLERMAVQKPAPERRGWWPFQRSA